MNEFHGLMLMWALLMALIALCPIGFSLFGFWANEWKVDNIIKGSFRSGVILAVISIALALVGSTFYVSSDEKALVIYKDRVNLYGTGWITVPLGISTIVEDWETNELTLLVYESDISWLSTDTGRGVLLASVDLNFDEVNPRDIYQNLGISSSLKFQKTLIEQVRKALESNKNGECKQVVKNSLSGFETYGVYVVNVNYCYR